MKPNIFVGVLTLVAVLIFAAMPALAAAPCCGVTSINSKTGEVTAKETATGRTFTFTANATLLKSLKVGQGIYANFSSKQVSIDGLIPCCTISTLSAASSPAPVDPCCGVQSIDLKTGTVTAKETATGRIFTFKVSDTSLLKSLKVGQGIFANFTSKQVSVTGLDPCCTIVSP